MVRHAGTRKGATGTRGLKWNCKANPRPWGASRVSGVCSICSLGVQWSISWTHPLCTTVKHPSRLPRGLGLVASSAPSDRPSRHFAPPGPGSSRTMRAMLVPGQAAPVIPKENAVPARLLLSACLLRVTTTPPFWTTVRSPGTHELLCLFGPKSGRFRYIMPGGSCGSQPSAMVLTAAEMGSTYGIALALSILNTCRRVYQLPANLDLFTLGTTSPTDIIN